MHSKISVPFLFLLFFVTPASFAQSVSSENIEIQLLQPPKFPLPEEQRTYKVIVTSPYSLSADDIIKNAKKKHEEELAAYGGKISDSEKEYQKKLKDYDADVKKAKDKYELENEAFKKLSLLERLSLIDQGKSPKLVLPSKPEYIKPLPPEYREPNLADYIIVNNQVLASQVNIEGLKKTGNNLEVMLDIQQAHFQDNAGQTYVNQPTRLTVKMNGKETLNKTYFTDYEFLSSSPTSNINQPQEEKNYLTKVMTFVNRTLTENFGYSIIKKQLKIESVKNKGKYDDLEKADIYIMTNLRKLQPSPDPEENAAAYAGLQKGIDIWLQTLTKVEYKNTKADFNPKIAKFIYLNLIRLNVALGNKKEAEKYLNQLQENLVDINLGNDEEKELQSMEKIIYKKN